MKLNAGISLIIGLFLVSSCVSNKKIIYLQELETGTTIEYDSLIQIDYPEYRLQVGDIINIEVRSIDPTVTAIFQSIAIKIPAVNGVHLQF